MTIITNAKMVNGGFAEGGCIPPFIIIGRPA